MHPDHTSVCALAPLRNICVPLSAGHTGRCAWPPPSASSLLPSFFLPVKRKQNQRHVGTEKKPKTQKKPDQKPARNQCGKKRGEPLYRLLLFAALYRCCPTKEESIKLLKKKEMVNVYSYITKKICPQKKFTQPPQVGFQEPQGVMSGRGIHLGGGIGVVYAIMTFMIKAAGVTVEKQIQCCT